MCPFPTAPRIVYACSRQAHSNCRVCLRSAACLTRGELLARVGAGATELRSAAAAAEKRSSLCQLVWHAPAYLSVRGTVTVG